MWLDRLLAWCARGPGFESWSVHVTFCGAVWVHEWATSSKGATPSVPAWFRAYSSTNLIKQEEVVTGRPCGWVAQWTECSHGMREVLGFNPGRAMCFSFPCEAVTLTVARSLVCYSSRRIKTFTMWRTHVTFSG